MNKNKNGNEKLEDMKYLHICERKILKGIYRPVKQNQSRIKEIVWGTIVIQKWCEKEDGRVMLRTENNEKRSLNRPRLYMDRSCRRKEFVCSSKSCFLSNIFTPFRFTLRYLEERINRIFLEFFLHIGIGINKTNL